MNKPAGGFEYRVVHQSKIELVVRTTPDSGCIVALQRTGAPGHKQPPALKKRLQEVGPRQDATRSHATLTAIRCPHSGLE